MKPVRIQLRRAARWRLQEASMAINGLPAKSCARPTIMGNPFGWQTPQLDAHTGRRNAVRDFERWWDTGKLPHSHRSKREEFAARREKMLAAASEYRGHNLGCFCQLGQACHVDIVLDRVNR